MCVKNTYISPLENRSNNLFNKLPSTSYVLRHHCNISRLYNRMQFRRACFPTNKIVHRKLLACLFTHRYVVRYNRKARMCISL